MQFQLCVIHTKANAGIISAVCDSCKCGCGDLGKGKQTFLNRNKCAEANYRTVTPPPTQIKSSFWKGII